jgi:catecholate siderophore receptor
LFTTYALNDKAMIGGGANYVSSRYAGSSASGAGTDAVTGTYRSAPSYLTFNAMAKYQATKHIGLQLNIINLTNEYYYDQIRGSNAVVPGDGRTFMLTTNVSF